MSVQLIVFPQSYNGSNNALSNTNNQFLIDGISFTTVSNSSTYVSSAANLKQDAIDNYSSIAVNTWARYRNSASTIPSGASGQLVFQPSSGAGTGVIQKLSNLAVSSTYVVTFDIASNFTGTLTMQTYSGTVLQSSQVISNPSTGTATLNFTANTTSDTILFDWDSAASSGASNFLFINSISIIDKEQRPSETISDLSTGEVIVDLYENEDIPLTLSVDDFTNAAEKVQSYSKAFNLPATKRNNKIFDNIFEITRTTDGIVFNPYVKTQCILKQNGYILFEGYLKLIDVSDKSGEISYNVNLYSEVIALADVLKDRTFADLDLSELYHNYNKTSIKNSWDNSTGLPLLNPLSTTSFAYDAAIGVNNTNVLKYPFVDWTHQILRANGSTGSAATLDYPELTSLEQAFRPFIQVKYLIEKIFDAPNTPFTFSSDFFDTADFKKLFMDFNWGSAANPETLDNAGAFDTGTNGMTNVATTSYTNLKLEDFTPLFNYILPTNYNQSTNILTATINNEIYDVTYNYIFENIDSSSHTIECQWLHNTTQIDYSTVITIPANSTWTWSGNFLVVMNNTDTLKAQFKADAGSVIRQFQNSNFITDGLGAFVNFVQNPQVVTNSTMIQALRGELGQFDFLKGIMTMFNLVSIPDPDNPTNIIFEPYADVFINNTAGTNLASRSIQYDWTDKIDVEEIKLTPLTDLNKKTIFKFVEDDDDYTFNVYKSSTGGHLYGSKIYDASAFTILEGTDEIIAEPFAATVSKPLSPEFADFIIPSIFTSNDEATEFEGFDNSPRILYNNGKKTLAGGVTYYIPPQNGLASENQSDFLQFSHLNLIPNPTTDFHFGECQLVNPIGFAPADNLFNTYWLPYYSELYNPDTRTMTIKVNLNAADINRFKFSDTVFIKNRVFRVNRIDYKPNDLATVEFILIP
jgi:hypothetical protein